MLPATTIIIAALAYIGLLFAVAQHGDRSGARYFEGRWRPIIATLTMAVYCTSWTFLGAVGLASTSGLNFLTIYIGPIIVIGLLWPLLQPLVRLAKAHNATSIADFVSALYGKNSALAGLVALIAVAAVVPYIALQIKAIASVMEMSKLTAELRLTDASAAMSSRDPALFVTIMLAAFAVAFGTRNVDATEHQNGLMLSIALESIVKLIAFVAVGAFVTWGLFGGVGDLIARADERGDILPTVTKMPDASQFLAYCLLSAIAILFLPRQYHVIVTENRSEQDLKQTAWLFPLYLLAINLFILPIAIAGQLTFTPGTINPDLTVIALPVQADAPMMSLIALIGAFSAATAMVLVECVALSIIISNSVVMPLIIRYFGTLPGARRVILLTRRISILLVLFLAYLYFRTASDAALASIGFLSFAGVAQIAPVTIGGLIWRGASHRGALAGLFVGILLWVYTLVLPSLAQGHAPVAALLAAGPAGIEWLRPTAMFGLELGQVAHGVVISLGGNLLVFALVSLLLRPTEPEALQRENFFRAGFGAKPLARISRGSLPLTELMDTLSRYLGHGRTLRELSAYASGRGVPLEQLDVDDAAVRFSETLLASTIGPASSRLVMSQMRSRRSVSARAARQLVDAASEAIHFNRSVLQQALDHARQGMTVFDSKIALVTWNRAFQELFELPDDLLRPGVKLARIIEYNMSRGAYGPRQPDDYIERRLNHFTDEETPFRLTFALTGRVIEFRSTRLPDGGVLTTYTDVTSEEEAAQALARANDMLEQRVAERTEELTRVNGELNRAKQVADEANRSKSRLIAATSHDILQPLNAARIYAAALSDKVIDPEAGRMTGNITVALGAIEDILAGVLDTARLESGVLKPEITNFSLGDLFRDLRVNFEPIAANKGLELVIVDSSLMLRSDRRLLRRVLQNLISNAIKYTPKGRILIGVRRRAGFARISVIDTGVGIPTSKQKFIFREFKRLSNEPATDSSVGLGLSIVDRIARLLAHPIELASATGSGSRFTISVPLSGVKPKGQVVPEPPPVLPFSGLRVLAVDNEPMILEALSQLLTGWGVSIVTAATVAEARRQLAKGAPDLALIDYHLDEESGIEVAELLRKQFDSVPAALVTAERGEVMRNDAERLGLAILAKPVRPAALRSLLAHAQSRKAAAAE